MKLISEMAYNVWRWIRSFGPSKVYDCTGQLTLPQARQYAKIKITKRPTYD